MYPHGLKMPNLRDRSKTGREVEPPFRFPPSPSLPAYGEGSWRGREKNARFLEWICLISLCIKDARAFEEKEKRTKQMTGKAIQELTDNTLRMLHGDKPNRKALAGKLAFAVKQTIKRIVDGEQPTIETVKGQIDMDKLAHEHPEVEKTDESRQQYATAVLRACKHACQCFDC